MRVLVFACLLLVCCFAHSKVKSRSGETVIFHDDFTKLDTKVWKHEITMSGGGNWEFEQYWNNRSNSYTRDSVLYIKPTLLSEVLGEACITNGCSEDIWGDIINGGCTDPGFYGCQRNSVAGQTTLNPVLSARIRSAESFSFAYGRMEVKAKMPKGDWLWPAIWLLPRYQAYGQWPASGEIDVVESRGNVGYPKQFGGGPESVGSTLHWGPGYPRDGWKITHNVFSLPSGDFNSDFHTFGLFWNSTTLYTYVDDESQKILTVDFSQKSLWDQAIAAGYNWVGQLNPWAGSSQNAPFDQEYYLIMNLAVGGISGYFPDGVAGKPWADNSNYAGGQFWGARGAWYPTWNNESSALQVDSVTVWGISETTKTNHINSEKDSDDERAGSVNVLAIGFLFAVVFGSLIGGAIACCSIKRSMNQRTVVAKI